MEGGTVLQNNYNTDGYESDGSGRPLHTAGALHIVHGGSLTMDGGLIQDCYTAGAGGGIQSGQDSQVTAASSTIRNCYAAWGGGVDLRGSAEFSGMTFTGNAAGSSGGGISSTAPLTVTDSLFDGNRSAYDGGGVCTGTGHQAHITGCTFTGNTAPRGSAIQTFKGEGELPLVIRDCNITGNLSAGFSHAGGAICYMNETGIILSGKIVMEDNLAAGYEPCDIHYFYNTGASILLDEDFESASTFVLGGYDSIKPGRVLIDGTLYHKDASPEQFPWHTTNYCTEKRGENIYLAEVPKTYVVTYDANNSTAGSSIMCSDPNKYTSEDTVVIMDQAALFPLMGNIVRFGYDFDGWNTEADGTGTDYEPGQETNLTGNLYLYVKWKAKEPVTLTYIYNDGEGKTDSEQVIPGANVAFPDASRKGYSFKGWYEDEALTVFAGNAGEKHYAPQQDASYYAAWEKEEATVTFDADGGKMEGGNVTARIGDTITLPDCTKDGYEFVGWYDGDTCIGQAGEEYTVSDDVTLKARYVKKGAATGTITFDADGGKMEGGNVTAKVGDTITLPDCTKDGHEFIGWYDNDTCAGKAGEKYTVTGDVTLKAHYEKKAEVTYLITFDPNGGRKADHIRAAKGEKIILPGTEKSGYIFLGWYTEKKGGILLGLAGDELEVTKDMTVYALWEKEKAEEAGDKDQETCRAVFHTEGGTLKNKTVTIAKGAGLYLPLPEREGYDFTGWYLDQSLTQFAGDYRDSYRITKDIDFYAKWEKSKENGTDQGSNAETAGTYTVKYDANGGTVKESSAEVAKGAGVKLPAAEREGFNFKGWYTDKQVFIGMAGDTYKPEGDICLYAKWESAASGNSNGSTADTGNSSDANAETSTDSSAAGKSADTGAGVSGTAAVKEPMFHTNCSVLASL
ncbi:internalin-A [Lachnospiraceae bacterium]|nr:internalin-A [Lachnospiraceae bacterium]